MKPFPGRLRWLLIAWVFLMSAVAYLDRVNISIAAQAVQKEFDLTNVQLGWVFSSFVLGYALFQAPGGRLADRFGPRRVIAVGVLWWGIFTTATALVPSGIAGALAVLIATRFVLGLGEAVMFPSSNRFVAAWIPSAERGIANGLIFAGVGAGAGVTPPLITFVLLNWGWRWSFFVSALIGLAAGVGWYLLARDTPRKHPWITDAEADRIERGLPEPDSGAAQSKPLPLSAVVRSRSMLAVTVSYFTYGYIAYIFFTWFFTYLTRVRGLDLKASAFYSMLPFIAMALCSPLGGWLADNLSRRYGKRTGRCAVAGVGLALCAVFITLATQVRSAELASIVLAGGAGALYLSQSSFWAVTADIAGPSAGFVSGLMNMCNQIGGALTGMLTPWIADQFGWTASFLVAAALAAVGGLAWALVDPEARIEPEHV